MPHLEPDHDLPPQESAEFLVLEVSASLGRVVDPFVGLEPVWPEVLPRNPIMRRLILAVSALGLHKRDLNLNLPNLTNAQNNFALNLAYMYCMQILYVALA